MAALFDPLTPPPLPAELVLALYATQDETAELLCGADGYRIAGHDAPDVPGEEVIIVRRDQLLDALAEAQGVDEDETPAPPTAEWAADYAEEALMATIEDLIEGGYGHDQDDEEEGAGGDGDHLLPSPGPAAVEAIARRVHNDLPAFHDFMARWDAKASDELE